MLSTFLSTLSYLGPFAGGLFLLYCAHRFNRYRRTLRNETTPISSQEHTEDQPPTLASLYTLIGICLVGAYFLFSFGAGNVPVENGYYSYSPCQKEALIAQENEKGGILRFKELKKVVKSCREK